MTAIEKAKMIIEQNGCCTGVECQDIFNKEDNCPARKKRCEKMNLDETRDFMQNFINENERERKQEREAITEESIKEWARKKVSSLKLEPETIDSVNHPSHYAETVPGIECIDVTKHFNFCRGNAIKYIWRAGHKNDEIEDLKKAIKYLEFEIERIEKGGQQ
jgi:hypothetical protein